MNDDDIPVKTADGVAEIKTRTRRLASRVRTVLLLVDGVKSIAELKKLMPDSGAAQQALEILADKGLIDFPQRRDKPPSSDLPAGTHIIEFPSLEPQGPVQLSPEAATGEVQASVPSSVLQPASDQSASDQSASDQSASDQSASDQPASDQSASDQPASDQPASEQPALDQSMRQPEAPADAPAVAKRHASKQLVVLIARAHLANALDEHLGFDGYLLRQDVVDCSSREQLESLFGKIESSLIVPLGNAGAASVIERVRSIFDTQAPQPRPLPS